MGKRNFDKTTTSLNIFASCNPSESAMNIWKAAHQVWFQKGRQCNNWRDNNIVICRTSIAVIMAFVGFVAPIMGGMMWVSLNPAAPFVMVGIMELLLVPVYYIGMKRYQQALFEQAAELKNE